MVLWLPRLLRVDIVSNVIQMFFYSKIVVIATGRNGADFVNSICDKFSIPCATNVVDIGGEGRNEIINY